MKNEIPEIRTDTRISIQKLSIFIFAAYHLNMMACSIFTDSLIGWSGTLYYIKILMMVLGYAAFYGSRKAVGITAWRKYLLIASNVIYSAGLLLLMIIDNIVMITGVSLVVMFVLGYVGGAVYYFLSLRVSENPHGGRIIGLGGALAYILHYVLWALLGQEVIMIVVLLTLFVFVTYIVIRNPKEWATSDPLPYADKMNIEVRQDNSRTLLLLCGLTVAALLCMGRAHSIVFNTYADQSGVLYGLARLFAVPSYLIIGLLYDKKKRSALSGIMLLSMIITVWMPADFVYMPVVIQYIRQFCESFMIGYITFSFWLLAPKTDRPELWACFGRILMGFECLTGLLYTYIENDNIMMDYVICITLTALTVGLVIPEITGMIRSEVRDLTRQDIYSEVVSLQQEEEKNRRILFELTTQFRLTPRETDVVRIILREKDIRTNEIAEEMQISRTMVYRYINRLYEKTGTDEKQDLIGVLNRE
ncbi:MAG: HTH domain-containing protein [Lachnospiraceae bacterium]|nr:HTH domain-containing protein [Lachnospiraceae bacterium]